MEIYFLIMGVIICTLITLAISGIFNTSNNKPHHIGTDNENTPNCNNTLKRRTTTKLIENQNTIKYLTIFNTMLLIALIAIVVFVIIKIYPYLDTLKQYYEMLDTLINYPINGSYY